MAAVVTQATYPTGAQIGPLLFAESVATAIPATGNTVILEIPTLGLKNVGVEFDVTVNNLDAFVVDAQFHPNDAFHTLYSGITSTPAGLIIAASGTLATTAAAASGWFIMDVRGIYKIRMSVSGSVADTTAVTMRASGSR